MKLRSQFIILIFGIIVFPFLLAALVYFVQVVRSGKEIPANNIRNFENWFSRARSREQLEEMLDFFVNNKIKGIEILILDSNNRVLQSTFSDFDYPEVIGQDQLLGYIREKAADFHFLVNAFPLQDTDTMVILKVRKIDSLQEKIHTRIIIALEVTLALFLAAALISILIIRAFNRSIIRLRVATRKIAGGDLDFSLETGGKDEIADLTRDFDRMRLALKDEYGRRARFLMGVSHDLKTPLALILGYVDAIIDGHAVDEAKLNHFLAIIREKSRLLEQRISDLIEYVKLATGEWRMIHKEVALAAFLRRTAAHYERDAAVLKRSFSYRIDLPEDLVIPMDECLMERVLENIITNAMRYTNEADTICLTAEAGEREILIAVCDTGPGIKTEELGNIFDPFYRGSHSRQEPGLGLGLSIARSIILAHGWELAVQSLPGRETTFTIRIKSGSRQSP